MAYCAVLVLMLLRWIVSTVLDLGDMWCLKKPGEVLVGDDHQRNEATEMM